MSVPSIALGDAFEYIRNGMSIKQNKDGGGIPITRIETISDGTIDLNRVGYAGLQKQDAEKWFLQPGDILLSHINSVEHIGKCALFEAHDTLLVHGMNLLSMRPKKDLLLPRYAMWAMKDPSFKARILKYVNKAVNQASISTTNLKTIEIPLPPLEEQKRIAGILDQADALRRLRTHALDKLNTLGQAIFHKMFEEELRTGDEVGFEAIADIQVGHPFKSKSYIESGEGVRLCRGANVLPGYIDWSNTAKYPEELLDDVEPFRLCEGDVVLAMDRPWISSGFKVASIGQQDLPSYLVQRVARLRAKRNEDRTFLLTLVNSVEFQRHCRPTETTIPHISPLEIKSFRFRLPTEQTRTLFNLAMNSAMSSSAFGKAYLCKAEALFASLQHRAFREDL